MKHREKQSVLCSPQPKPMPYRSLVGHLVLGLCCPSPLGQAGKGECIPQHVQSPVGWSWDTSAPSSPASQRCKGCMSHGLLFRGRELCEVSGKNRNSCSADVVNTTGSSRGAQLPLPCPWLSQRCHCLILGCWDRCKSASRSHPAIWQANFPERLQ